MCYCHLPIFVTAIQGGKCDICKRYGTNPCPSCREEGGCGTLILGLNASCARYQD